ncbi:MAG: Ig-like domain-containing protein [Aeromonas veronii]
MNFINLRLLLISVFVLILNACGGEESGAPAQADIIVINSLQINQQNNLLPVGLEIQLTAQANMSDGDVLDVTTNPNVAWKSSNTAIAAVNTTGLVTGLTKGSVIITASGTNKYGNYFEATTSVEVTDAKVIGLQVTPPKQDVVVGLTAEFVATAILSDNTTLNVTNFSQLTWASSDQSIATINNQPEIKGQAVGVSPGEVLITASGTANGESFSATAELIVNNKSITGLRIDAKSASVPIGLEYPFTAYAEFSDGSSKDVTADPAVTWKSLNEDIAAFLSKERTGVATGISTGIAKINATGIVNGTSFSDTVSLSVTDAVVTQLDVTPDRQEVVEGLTVPFTAVAFLSDGDVKTVTDNAELNWSSLDTSVATVSNTIGSKGIVTGIRTGESTIRAFTIVNGKPFSDDVIVEVNNATVTQLDISPKNTSIRLGDMQPFSAMATFDNGKVIDVTNDPALSWSSSDPQVASITTNQNGNNGVATGVNPGAVMINAQGVVQRNILYDTTQLEVTPPTLTAIKITPSSAKALSLGRTTTETKKYMEATKQLTATGVYSDGTEQNLTNSVTWSSSNANAISVTSAGLIKAGQSGDATITATSSNVSASVSARAMPWIDVFKKPDTTRRSHADATTFCSNLGFRLGSVNEMKALFVDATLSSAAYPDSGTSINNGMCAVHGWPIGGSCGGSSNGYWTAYSGSGSYYTVHMNSGERITSGSSTGYYTACILY